MAQNVWAPIIIRLQKKCRASGRKLMAYFCNNFIPTQEIIFFSCYFSNGYHLDTVLLLSVFTGMFGLDRFYLGYYGMGLLKACTLGGFFIGQLVDIILIALQIVRPADGSHYIIPYYGAGVDIIRSNNETYRVPRDDW